MRKVKTPETDNQVVDHLYDDLTDAQREAFTAVLESDEDAAAEAQSYATLLKIYRDEAEELTPSVAATERLLRQAERAHLSIWARLFGDLPKLVMRPAVGFAMVAVLLIGGGVFYVLSQGPGGVRSSEGSHSTARKSAPSDRTVASAPESTTFEGRPTVAERAPSGAAAMGAPTPNDDKEGFAQDKDGRVQTLTTGNGYVYKTSKQGALAAAETRSRDRSKEKGLRGRKRRRMSKGGSKSFFRMNSRSGGGGVPRAAQPAKKPAAKPGPQQLNDSVQGVQQKTKRKQTKTQDQSAKKLTPPALHNRANKNLAKGKVAVACGMFGSLVRGHRGYNRRADALLGWARCEMARGSYSRAAQLVRQLIKEYPKWKKTGTSMLAQIKRRQSQAALRAQRVRRVKRRAPVRARPARRRSAPTSN